MNNGKDNWTDFEELRRNELEFLPMEPAIYFLLSDSNELLYVNTTSNLKERIITHLCFSSISNFDKIVFCITDCSALKRYNLTRSYREMYEPKLNHFKKEPFYFQTHVEEEKKLICVQEIKKGD